MIDADVDQRAHSKICNLIISALDLTQGCQLACYSWLTQQCTQGLLIVLGLWHMTYSLVIDTMLRNKGLAQLAGNAKPPDIPELLNNPGIRTDPHIYRMTTPRVGTHLSPNHRMS